jgi:hypothetical protein
MDIYNIKDLYLKTFGSSPFHVSEVSSGNDQAGPQFTISQGAGKTLQFTAKGSLIMEQLQGVEVWLPVRFFEGSELLMHLPYTVVKLNTKKTIIETPLAQRRGSVKEQFNVDDYSISIKGFLIGEDRQFPESQLEQLKALYLKSQAVILDNALTNIFLTDPELNEQEQRRVVIHDMDIAEVTGGRIHVRPFSLQLKSDSVFTLELND